MKSLLAIFAAVIIVFPAIAQEEEVETFDSPFGDFGRFFETLLAGVAEEIGEAADRIESAEVLDRTLSLTVEVSGHDSVSILCATSRFSIQSEHQGFATEMKDNSANDKHQNSSLELMGTVSETDEDGVYLIRYSGSFASNTHASENKDSSEYEKVEEFHLDFEGSARFSIGTERVLARKGERHIVLIVEEAE